MRIPARFQSKAENKPKPELFRSIRFVHCLRCMGHGVFQTNPPERVPMMAFSKEGALSCLIDLAERGRVSTNQYAAVETQIVHSSLPDEVPVGVKNFVNECLDKEVTLTAELTLGNAEESESPRHVYVDLGEVVHDFLLGPQGPPELKTQ